MNKNKQLLIAGLLLSMGIMLSFVYYHFWYIGEHCFTSHSPDQSYTLEASVSFRLSKLAMGGPGDGCSGKGWIRLKDREGRTLQEVHSYSLPDTYDIQWQPSRLSFRYTGKDGYYPQQWPLSESTPTQYQLDWYASPLPQKGF